MTPAPRSRLLKPHLMRELMERTGTGSGISGRELAAAVGVPPSTVDALLNGHTKTQPTAIAEHMCQVIGVDWLCLWAPTGRAVPADDEQGAAPRTAVAV